MSQLLGLNTNLWQQSCDKYHLQHVRATERWLPDVDPQNILDPLTDCLTVYCLYCSLLFVCMLCVWSSYL